MIATTRMGIAMATAFVESGVELAVEGVVIVEEFSVMTQLESDPARRLNIPSGHRYGIRRRIDCSGYMRT